MILILLGWEFLLAELLGGLILIAVMAVIVHLTLPENLFDEVRETLNERDRGAGVTEDPTCGMEGREEYTFTTEDGETLTFCSEGCMETYRQEGSSRGGWREELLSWGDWYKIGNQYRKDWSMIWKDVVGGFLISGFVYRLRPPVGVEHPVRPGRRPARDRRERDCGCRHRRHQLRRQYAPSGFFLYVYRRGIDAPGQYRDPVCGIRIDDSGPSLTHDDETYYFCSNRCKRSFENHPTEFAHHPPTDFGGGVSQEL